ncbi:MAG: site-specific integrase [Planctomycetota bacterium]|nr:site-specific integrase [Planctomycetota bacterium]
MPFLAVVSQYVERLEGRASHRLAQYCLEVWTEFCGYADLVYVHEFTLTMQEKFIKWRRTSRSTGLPISNGTMNRFLEVARAAFHDGWKRGDLASIPYVRLLPKPAPRDRFLTPDEVQRLLAACTEPHLRRFVLIALHTLQRPSAILNLRVEQVDLTWNRIDFLPRGSIQHNKRRPIVPITATLRPELEKALEESVSGYVVELGGKRIKKLRHSFRTACTKAGIRDASPGVLRHTGATLLAAAGVPLREVSGMLGHTTSQITERVYAKRRPEFLAEAASVLDKLFPEVQVESGSKRRALLPKPLDSLAGP